MWIFLRDSYLSIIEHEEEPKLLQVRSRFRGDIEHVFPEAFVSEDYRGDYRFCATISRERVAHAIALRIQQIDYNSLNELVRDTDRGNAYDKAYGIMLSAQNDRYVTELDMPGYIPKYDLEAEIDPTETIVPKSVLGQ